VISQTLDLGYVLFAKNRLKLTGRCNSTTCDVPKITTPAESLKQ